MALETGALELAETITSFNALLRISMSQSNAFITVIEEIRNIQNYLNIQQKRYNFKIDFTYHAETDVGFAVLPKLILQPLVENALFHGIVPVKGGVISVDFHTKSDQLIIKISDNGKGISKKVLETE
jgi:two-component system sensor histidine kinase YesM